MIHGFWGDASLNGIDGYLQGGFWGLHTAHRLSLAPKQSRNLVFPIIVSGATSAIAL